MKSPARQIASLILIALLLLPQSSRACTIFVLMDAQRALFFNNEDYSNPGTRIWFVPAGTNYFGCAYVGFDDGWAQGGLNSEGLAFDWVAGYMDKYTPASNLLPVRGNSSQRMLETCSTLDQAIQFYRSHRENEFSRARIMVADKTGASAVIGGHDGELQVDRQTACRGFGYGLDAVVKMLANPPEPTIANGVKILRAALQQGEFATKYSNVYDLNSGDIFLFQLPQSDTPTQLNLHAELKKGPHYYDLPKIQSQLTAALLPLPNNTKRFFLDEFKPIPDTHPKITAQLTRLMTEAAAGKLTAADYNDALWKILEPQRDKIHADLKKFGPVKSLTLVNRLPADAPSTHRYKVNFAKAAILQTFTLDEKGRVANSVSEGAEFTP